MRSGDGLVQRNADDKRPPGRFLRDGPVDVVVVVVTYLSESDIDPLVESLRREAATHRMRLVIVDNGSTDLTVARAESHRDVVVVATGCNLGYSGGINRARDAVGEARAVLVLNPDTRMVPGCIADLQHRMSASRADLVVPALETPDGVRSRSLRREPTVWRRLGDAVFGRFWDSRPPFLSETVRRASDYDAAHPIDWATGAALLISAHAAELIGDWDERFFLYSEETDYFRRARDLGLTVWYEPAARVVHREGGSGGSPELVALMVVNSIRYVEKHNPAAAPVHRVVVALHELRRWRNPSHRIARTILLRRKAWARLPRAGGCGPETAKGVGRDASPGGVSRGGA